METSKALNELKEAADLIGMVEEMSNPAIMDRLNPTSLAGLRVTLRNIERSVRAAHDVLSGQMVAKARSEIQAARPAAGIATAQSTQARPATQPITRTQIITDNKLSREDLRASLEKFVDR